mmetsp:Transcript_8622/g.21551  ORF Transcript_8622/g.21551 Transcript_8622/m.21551 type:complete len:309 (+) Transcript_8622:2-928(+)
MCARFFRFFMTRRHRTARHFSSASSLNIDSYGFWIKFALERDAFFVLGSFIIGFTLWSAYVLKITESPQYARRGDSSPFIDYGNCVWLVIVTMTTTGYGDVSPTTGIGRVTAVVVMCTGLALAAIITALLNDRLSLNPHESRFVDAIAKATVSTQRSRIAAQMIQDFFKYTKRIKKHPEDKVQALAALRRTCFESNVKRAKCQRQSQSKPSLKALIEDIHSYIDGALQDKIERLHDSIAPVQHKLDTILDRLEDIAREDGETESVVSSLHRIMPLRPAAMSHRNSLSAPPGMSDPLVTFPTHSVLGRQ